MNKLIRFYYVLLFAGIAQAGEMRISSAEPLFVTAQQSWRAAMFKSNDPKWTSETARIIPVDGRNAMCVVTILGKDKAEFADPAFLKKLLRGDSRPYMASLDDLIKVPVKEMKPEGAIALYSNFIDPNLVEAPFARGFFKTATPIIIGFGTNYLIKATILCDEINGPDHKELLKMVESMKFAKPTPGVTI